METVIQVLALLLIFYMLTSIDNLYKKEQQFYGTKEGYKIFLEREKTKREYYKYKYSKGCEKHEKNT